MKFPSYKKLQDGRPLRSTQELASEFGIEHRSLAAILRRAIGAPKPVLRTAQHGVLYFDPAIVRAWWKTYSAKRKSLAPQG